MQVRPIEKRDKFYLAAEQLVRSFVDGKSLDPLELRFPLDAVPEMDSLAEVVVIVAIARHEPNKRGVVLG